MPDITMCAGGGCELCKTCYRRLAKASEWQSWFTQPPAEDDCTCEYYWPVSEEVDDER